MSLGLLLLILAIVLAIVGALVPARSIQLVATAVVLLAIAVLLGVSPLAIS